MSLYSSQSLTEEEPTTSFDNLSLNYFHPSSDEVNELDKFNLFTFTYIKERVKITSPSHVHTPGMQSFLKVSDIMHVHEQLPSTYKFVDILNMHADSKDAVLASLSKLYREAHVGETIQHIVVAGDAKIYPYLIDLKKEYPSRLKWVIPFMGDFHVLLNYQEALMKVYWDAGLK